MKIFQVRVVANINGKWKGYIALGGKNGSISARMDAYGNSG